MPAFSIILAIADAVVFCGLLLFLVARIALVVDRVASVQDRSLVARRRRRCGGSREARDKSVAQIFWRRLRLKILLQCV